MSFVRTEPGADPIVVEGHVQATPARVFEAWTEPAIVKQWFGPEPGTLAEASIDLRPGGRWRFVESATAHGFTAFEGEYLDVVVDELLVFTWAKVIERRAGRREETPPSKVEISFVPASGGTDLRIVHSSLDRESRIGFRFGWEAGTANLVAFLAAESPVAEKLADAERNE